MKMRPLHDRLLVKRVEGEAKSKGGIIIPDTAKEKPQEGKVIAAGSGRITDDGKVVPLEVKKGDRVLFGKYSTIAEGVETEEQRNILHLLRCDMGQGFYFSPAVPAEEFEKLLG